MIFKRFRNKNKNNDKKAGGQKPSRRGSLGPSILTGEVVIDGHLLSGGELQIDGEINGDVRARAVVIDINGIVHGEVAAEDIIVRGRIIGPIRGLHVHILSGSHVEGDIFNETVSIENGAFVDGKIHHVDDPLGLAYGHNEQQPDSHYDGPNNVSGNVLGNIPVQKSQYDFTEETPFVMPPSNTADKEGADN